MNRQNFEATDRFPLSTQALTFIQEMVFATAQLALIGGDNYILSGCAVSGNTVSDGVIVIAGEPMPFKGGAAAATITIVEETIPVSANGITFDKARTKRHAKFASGTGANYLPWADFKPLATNKQLEKAKATVTYVDDAIAGIQAGSIPKGVIVMWGGAESEIPTGWCLCDGRTLPDGNKVPDLKGRFVVGYNPTEGSGYDKIRDTGGEKEIKLSLEQIPAHNHLNGIISNQTSMFINGATEPIYTGGRAVRSGDYSENNQGYTSKTGGLADETAQAHENRPPYYVLAYIIKL